MNDQAKYAELEERVGQVERPLELLHTIGPVGVVLQNADKPEVGKHGQRHPEQRRELLNVSRLQDLCQSSVLVRSTTSTLTTTAGAAPSHPRAVERGTSKSVAMVRSPLRGTSSGADGQSVAGGRDVVFMR